MERTHKAQEDVIEGSIAGTSLAFEDQKKGPVGKGRCHISQVIFLSYHEELAFYCLVSRNRQA